MRDDDLATLVKNSNTPSGVIDVTAFRGVSESDLTAEDMSEPVLALVRRRPHLRYLQRAHRLDWLARILDEPEIPELLKLKALELLMKATGDFKQEAPTGATASNVLIVYDNGRGGGDDNGRGGEDAV